MRAEIFEKLSKHGITMQSFPSLFEALLEVCEEVVKEEREACCALLEKMHVDSAGQHNYYLHAAQIIRATK